MPQPIQLVLLAAYEPLDSPIPGELTLFRQRNALTTQLPFPLGFGPLFTDSAGTLALATGVGAARAAASTMALGLDPRFDLARATFLITGVAGISPERGSLASVVLPTFVVDGSLTHELDAREIPPDDPAWPDGFVPLGKITPCELPRAARFGPDDGILFPLHEPLVSWAFHTLRELTLLDTPEMAARRRQFAPADPAHHPPFVLRGDELASSTFFHGRLLSQRAARWVHYQSEGRATYAITAMEDAGILQSLTALASAGRIDSRRTLIVRAASNFDQQRPTLTAAQSLAETRVATCSAYRPALENAHRAATRLMDVLHQTWPALPGDQ